MTTGAQQIGEAGEAWEAVRADEAIQFTPVEVAPPEPREPPSWLDAFFEWLGSLLEPLGRALGLSWPVFKWVLLAIGVGAALLLLWRMLAPALGWRPRPGEAGAEEADWTPDAGAALALLEDADRLAADGRYDEATHLLLQRSIGQIADVRPDLVEPATTARELSALSALTDSARAAFGTIATRVERSLFALRSLDRDDWQAARAAYAEFALATLPQAV
ncbi:hypothetical protein ACWPM1_03545 [Tsuneonella sp. HG249]